MRTFETAMKEKRMFALPIRSAYSAENHRGAQLSDHRPFLFSDDHRSHSLVVVTSKPSEPEKPIGKAACLECVLAAVLP